MSKLPPPRVCPSRRPPSPSSTLLHPPPPPSELNPQLLPHGVDSLLGLGIHDDLVRPLAREAFLLPLARGVDAHLRSEGEAATRVLEHVDRTHGEPHVALGVDVVQRHPPCFSLVLHVHVLVEVHDYFGARPGACPT